MQSPKRNINKKRNLDNMPAPQEQPIYVLAQSKKRAIIPKILTFLILGVIFYLGILLNVSLLELDARQETIFKTVPLIILIVVIVVGIFLTLKRAKKKYHFYAFLVL